MDEEVKGFNRYMSKVDFQPVTEFIFQNGQLTDYKKGEFFSEIKFNNSGQRFKIAV